MLGRRDCQSNPCDEDGGRAQPRSRGPSRALTLCIRTFRAHSCDSPASIAHVGTRSSTTTVYLAPDTAHAGVKVRSRILAWGRLMTPGSAALLCRQQLPLRRFAAPEQGRPGETSAGSQRVPSTDGWLRLRGQHGLLPSIT